MTFEKFYKRYKEILEEVNVDAIDIKEIDALKIYTGVIIMNEWEYEQYKRK